MAVVGIDMIIAKSELTAVVTSEYLGKVCEEKVIEGPLEVVSYTMQRAVPQNLAEQYMGGLYLTLLEHYPTKVNRTKCPNILALPLDHKTINMVVREDTISIELGTLTYYITVNYHWGKGFGWCEAASSLDGRYVHLYSIHYIYGVGSIVSAVKAIASYCDNHVLDYVQCHRCKYTSTDNNYCGKGLEMHTGNCGQWVSKGY